VHALGLSFLHPVTIRVKMNRVGSGSRMWFTVLIASVLEMIDPAEHSVIARR
jgi:hypothetical protein